MKLYCVVSYCCSTNVNISLTMLTNVQEKKVVVETNGPHIARISVFETNRFSKNTLVGYCEVDLFELLTKVQCLSIQFGS
jgi:hypothetical protein